MKQNVPSFLQWALAAWMFAILVEVQGQPDLVGEVPVNSTNFTRAGNLVYFISSDSLWRTDGTAPGTVFLIAGVSSRSVFIEFNGLMFFLNEKIPDDSRLAWKELWRSDGTPSGTFRVKSSSAYNVHVVGGVGDYLYFAASDPDTGTELFKTNGTPAGAVLVRDVNQGPADGFSGAGDVVGDAVFFSGNDGVEGFELWKSDGTSSGTVMIKAIRPGPESGFLSGNMFVTNDRIYFAGVTEENGSEPWTSDGTAGGTQLLADIIPGPEGQGFIDYRIGLNGLVYFIVKPPYSNWWDAGAHADLWKSGGTSSSTEKVTTLGDASTTFDDPFRIYQGKIYFASRLDGGPHLLCMTDGSSAGTQCVFNMMTYEGLYKLDFFDVVNDYLLFYGTADGSPSPFFRSDGTQAGTTEFTRFNSTAYLRGPKEPTKVNGFVFYADHDGPSDEGYNYEPDDYYQLIQSDGVLVQSVRSIEGTSLRGADNIVEFNGRVLFTTQDDQYNSSDTRKRLWIYAPKPLEPIPYFMVVNADNDRDIRKLGNEDTLVKSADESISIRFEPQQAVGSVVFQLNNMTSRTENAAPYSLAGDVEGDYAPWKGAVPGRYTLTATAYSEAKGAGAEIASLTIHFTIEGDQLATCTASGTILREYWDNVSGNYVSYIPVDKPPAGTSLLTIFQGPTNVGTNYGARIRGYICAPATGNYIFWISSNDHSELWLGTDDNPANRRRIAYVTGATNPLQWDKYATQRSIAISLVAGKRYYIEALHKQGIGTDHVAVGWQLPDGTLERPISGNRLSAPDGGGNAAPLVSIESPDDGQTFNPPAGVAINVTATDRDGTVAKVEFYSDSQILAEDQTSPYSYAWEDVPPGTHVLTAKAIDNLGAATTSSPVTITVTGQACYVSETITRDYWADVRGNSVSDIPVSLPPTSTSELTIFEGPTNAGTNYGARIRGYICPPMTGEYVFFIASNDHSELWLSTGEDPSKKIRIAYVTGATDPREWTKYATQRSSPVSLTQGTRYYVEALHKQGAGTDHVAVGWQLPNLSTERPIPGRHLSAFEPVAQSMASTGQSPARENVSSYSAIAVYPNPAESGDTHLTISGYEGIEQTVETEVEIINMTGGVVLSDRVSCGGNCTEYLMKVNEELRPGLYLVNLKTDGVRHSRRLLVK